MSDHSPKDTGSFTTGFTLGLFAGAAGYYLFGTEQGAKLRKQIVAEWNIARVDLAKEGVLPSPNVSLRQFVSDLLNKAFNFDLGKTPQNRVLIADSSVGKKAAKSKKETTHKFKGV
jgi:hypothetical protein